MFEYFVPSHLCQWVDCKNGQAGQVGVVEAAGGVGGVVWGDGEHLALRLCGPVGRGEREPVVSSPVQREGLIIKEMYVFT